MSSEIVGDILRGVKRIAQFIDEDERATYYKLATGKLPGGKEGNKWVASKCVLRAYYERITKDKAA
jgi:hypothetical protein